MELITPEIRELLLANHDDESGDAKPVVKFFTPDAGATWLIFSMDPEENDLLFGLCDLGVGFPELGLVRLSELEDVRGGLGLPVERDLHWEPKLSLNAYASLAAARGRIVEL